MFEVRQDRPLEWRAKLLVLSLVGVLLGVGLCGVQRLGGVGAIVSFLSFVVLVVSVVWILVALISPALSETHLGRTMLIFAAVLMLAVGLCPITFAANYVFGGGSTDSIFHVLLRIEIAVMGAFAFGAIVVGVVMTLGF